MGTAIIATTQSIFYQQLFLIWLAMIEIYIGLYVFSNNPRSIINRSFFILILGVGLWIIGVSLLYITHLFIFDKLVFAGAFLFIIGLVLFIKSFPYGRPIERKFYFSFIPWILLYLFLPFNLFIKDISIDFLGRVEPVNGPLFPAFLILFIFYIGISAVLATRQYKNSLGLARTQMQYLFLAFAILIASIIIFDLIFPAFGIYQLNLLGPIATFLFTILISYAIVVYHLMDIWVIVRLGSIFTILFVIISVIYIGTITILGKFIGGSLSLVLTSFLITITFEPLKKFVENKTDKIFFRRHYRVEDVINEITPVVHRLELNLEKISEVFNDIIRKYFKVESAALAILTPKGTFLVIAAFDGKDTQFELRPDNPIAVFLNANSNFTLNKEKMAHELNSGNLDMPVERIELVPEVYEELDKMNFILAIPIEANGKLIGIYFIGGKKSKDSFISQDLKLLDHLIGEAGGFLNNARLYEDLKKLDEAKSNFISVVSHQLRTPISAMRWSMELLLDGGVDRKTQKEFLQDTYKNSIFIIYHLDDMLTALDIEDKQIDLKKEICDFRNIIDEVLRDNLQILKSKKLDVKINSTDTLSQASLDCKKMKKIMEVLLANAFHYTPLSGGKVEINIDEKNIDDKKFLEVSILDNGIGIASTEQRYVFEKFFRGEEAKKYSPNGFGLGLFIVRAFVKAHGGDIYFESAGRNKGSKFYFMIPKE